jgi:hypothetical protein
MKQSARRPFIVCAFILVFIPGLPGHVAAAGGETAKAEIQKLTLFKNGLGFVVSRAVLPENSTTVRLGQLPVPSFGTFWIGYPKAVRLQSLVASMEETARNIPAQSIGQLVQANVGRRVIVHTGDRDIEGVVLPAALPDPGPPAPGPYFMSPRTPDPYNSDLRPAPQADILMIKSDKGTVVLSVGAVIRAEFTDREPVATISLRTVSPSIRIQLEKPAPGESVTVSCLAHGVTWVPGYLIDLSDPKTAKFSAHAEIINELADLDHVSLQLTTGFPNLKFGELLSPIAKSQALADFLRSLSGGGTASGGGRSMLMSQMAILTSNSVADADMSSIAPAYSTATEGLVAEDFFFYPVKDFSLKKDETAWIPLFTADMPYKHIYTWRVPDLLDDNDHYQTAAEQAGGGKTEEVWHSCRLVNTLAMPLTTASAEFITNGEFTGQDLCYYTAPKTETTIRINKALNILAEQAESEVERKRDATVIHGYHYDLVKIRGELKLRNRIDKAVDIEITKELSGDVLESLPRAGDVKSARGLKQVNTKHILTWVVQIEPGEDKTVTYQYQVYFRE